MSAQRVSIAGRAAATSLPAVLLGLLAAADAAMTAVDARSVLSMLRGRTRELKELDDDAAAPPMEADIFGRDDGRDDDVDDRRDDDVEDDRDEDDVAMEPVTADYADPPSDARLDDDIAPMDTAMPDRGFAAPETPGAYGSDERAEAPEEVDFAMTPEEADGDLTARRVPEDDSDVDVSYDEMGDDGDDVDDTAAEAPTEA